MASAARRPSRRSRRALAVRVPRQHLPLADRRGRDARARRARGAGGPDRARLGGHRRLARGQPARRARERRGAGARGRARGRCAAGAPARTSPTSTCCSRWTARTARAAAHRAGRARAREGAAAARVRSRERGRGATSTCPTPTTAGSGGFEEVLDLVQAACAGLLERDPRAPRRRDAAAGRTRVPAASGAATSTRPSA